MELYLTRTKFLDEVVPFIVTLFPKLNVPVPFISPPAKIFPDVSTAIPLKSEYPPDGAGASRVVAH